MIDWFYTVASKEELEKNAKFQKLLEQRNKWSAFMPGGNLGANGDRLEDSIANALTAAAKKKRGFSNGGSHYDGTKVSTHNYTYFLPPFGKIDLF